MPNGILRGVRLEGTARAKVKARVLECSWRSSCDRAVSASSHGARARSWEQSPEECASESDGAQRVCVQARVWSCFPRGSGPTPFNRMLVLGDAAWKHGPSHTHEKHQSSSGFERWRCSGKGCPTPSHTAKHPVHTCAD